MTSFTVCVIVFAFIFGALCWACSCAPHSRTSDKQRVERGSEAGDGTPRDEDRAGFRRIDSSVDEHRPP